MGLPAAKKGDSVVGVDTHIVMVPNPSGQTPTPLPHPFTGKLDSELSDDVNIAGEPAATVGSVAKNDPEHTPTPPGVSFQTSPDNKATVERGSSSVNINGKAAARATDSATSCNDLGLTMNSAIIASGTVLIGG